MDQEPAIEHKRPHQERYQEPAEAQARRRRKSLKETTALPPPHQPTPPATGPPDDDGTPDELVPDPVVRRELGLTKMGLWRWSEDETLGFPVQINVRGKNYRSRKQLEAFKRRLITQAVKAQRDKRQRRAQAQGAA